MAKTGRQKPTLKSRHTNPSDEEINLHVKINKTIAMKVKKSETIENLKAILREKEGVHFKNGEELCFGSQDLRDNHRIMDYFIPQDSTIHFQEPSLIKLFFKMPSKKAFSLDVQKTSSLYDIKRIIHSKMGIQSNGFGMYYAGRLLEDFRTVVSQSIQSEATLHMIATPKETLSVVVETPTKDMIKVEARFTHTVFNVKQIVESKTNFSSEDWDLFNGANRLQNVKTVGYYEIKENDKLKLLPAIYSILVKTRTGETITLEVKQVHTVRDLKEQIYQKTEVPLNRQGLVFGGRVLEDDKNLSYYGIEEDFTLSMR